MKVILLEEVRGKGGEGDVVEVSRGFANNYLLRNHMALKATEGNLKQLEQRRKNIAKREEVRIANAEDLKNQLEGTEIIVKTKVGEEGQLFGSVTAQMVADGIQAERDVEIDRRRVEIRTPIKAVGAYEIEISLYRDIKALVKIVVVDETLPEDEAVAQALGSVDTAAVKAESPEPAAEGEAATEDAEAAAAVEVVEEVADVVEAADALEAVEEVEAMNEAASEGELVD